jgi:sporulation protein YlmC with PRC-barrel domain
MSTLMAVPALFAEDTYKETTKKEVTKQSAADHVRADRAADRDAKNANLPGRESQMRSAAGAVMRGKALIGMTIEDATGKNVGEIQDVILDHTSGRAPFIIATLDKDYGIGSNYVALPFQALQFRGEKQNPILVADRAKIESAQTFAKNAWPDFNNNKWDDDAYRHFGYEPYDHNRSDTSAAKAGEPSWTNRLSKLDDIKVKNRAGDDLGEVEEIFIDGREGRVAYALIQFGGYLGIKEHNTLVPFTALDLDPSQKVYYIDASKESIQAASFPEKAWPDYNDPTWGRQNAAHFNQEPYWETYGYAGARRGTMGTDYAYTRLFDGAANTTAVEGSIAGVDHYRINGDNNDGVRLKVQTSDGTYTWVDLGSQKTFDADHKMDFKTGERVKVTGAKATVLRASKVQLGDQTFDANTKSLRRGMSNLKDDLNRETRESWDKAKDQMKDTKDAVKDKLD